MAANNKSKKPVSMISQLEKYLVTHKKMGVGDVLTKFGITPEQTHRMVYDLRKMGYPITSTWVHNVDDPTIHYVIYSIPHNWSKKSLQK